MAHNHVPGTACCQQDVMEGNSLWQSIDADNITALNEARGSAKRIFKAYAARQDKIDFVESSDDPEMIIHVPFTSTVRARSVCLSAEPGMCPRNMRLYVNRPGLDFDDIAQGQAAMQELCLDPSGDPDCAMWHQLKASKFGNISSIQLHVVGNAGSDEGSSSALRIFFCGFKGDVIGHRHGAVVAVYESMAQTADHSARESSKPGFQLGT